MNELDLPFEPNDWHGRFGEMAPLHGRYWAMFAVVGPYDALYLLKMRELVRPYVPLGEPSPVDLFILSVGEAPIRSSTKIGGLPFWGRDRDWPISSTGEKIPFLAQFNLQCSFDIVGTMPGDILLLFAHPDFRDGIVIEWEHAKRAVDLVMPSDLPIGGVASVYFGSRWRCLSYPKADLFYNENWGELPGGQEVLDPWFLFTMLGMRVGDHPWQTSGANDTRPGERFVCSLCSIYPTLGQPFPFLNHEEPLSELTRGSYCVDFNKRRDGSAGIVNVVALSDGSFQARPGYV